MARRCPDCNKFVSLETQDPEIELEIDDDGADSTTATISGSVRVVRQCADCGTEMTEANFDIDERVENVPEAKTTEGHNLEVEYENEEATESGGGPIPEEPRGLLLRLQGELPRLRLHG